MKASRLPFRITGHVPRFGRSQVEPARRTKASRVFFFYSHAKSKSGGKFIPRGTAGNVRGGGCDQTHSFTSTIKECWGTQHSGSRSCEGRVTFPNAQHTCHGPGTVQPRKQVHGNSVRPRRAKKCSRKPLRVHDCWSLLELEMSGLFFIIVNPHVPVQTTE